jgi:putative nucleotidyltransferase with HDIG domain
MLRACRFSSQLGASIEAATFKSMQKNAHKILFVSKERWVSEITRLLCADSPVWGLRYLMDTGLMKYIIPELAIQKGYNQNSRYHDYELWEHTLLVVLESEATPLMRWAALLHDVGKPFVRQDKGDRSIYPMHEVVGAEMVDSIARRLKFSNEMRTDLVAIIKNHLDDASPLREADNKHKNKEALA